VQGTGQEPPVGDRAPEFDGFGETLQCRLEVPLDVPSRPEVVETVRPLAVAEVELVQRSSDDRLGLVCLVLHVERPAEIGHRERLQFGRSVRV
jgi:hypothetical protein